MTDRLAGVVRSTDRTVVPEKGAVGALSRLRARAVRWVALPRRTAGSPAIVVEEAPAGRGDGVVDTAVVVSDTPRRASMLGWFPALALVAACGLLAVVGANDLSRSAHGGGQLLFWLGLACIVLPVGWRLLSEEASRNERIALVVLAGVALYLVKVARDPFEFTFSDELVHEFNADEILRTHFLLSANPILAATPDYPGLETVTAALAALSGLATFGAGLVVICAARILIGLGLFLLVEQVSHSARVAGVAALVYAGAPNYLYFSAQFSYESLALPLGVFVLYATARWLGEENPAAQQSWAIAIVLATSAVIVTHHMTSYALIAFLVVAALAHRLVSITHRDRSLWPFALFAILAAGVWLVFVASRTVGYLSPVFTDAIDAAIETVRREAPPRTLFSSDSGVSTPVWERATAFMSVLVVALGVSFGLLVMWRRYRRGPIALVLALAGVAYLGTFGLRLIPEAWEVAIRASEFLFVGASFLLALAGVGLLRTRRVPVVGRVAVLAALGVVVAGGVISGWPRDLRLGQTYRVAVGDRVIEAEGRAAARWSGQQLGGGRVFAADASNARLLLAHAGEPTRTGSNPPIDFIIRWPFFAPWEIELLANQGVRYVLVDRRFVSDDAISGYFFTNATSPARQRLAYPPSSYRKFDRLRTSSRIFDSGDVVIYDVKKVVAGAGSE